jgi:hypothetical protein
VLLLQVPHEQNQQHECHDENNQGDPVSMNEGLRGGLRRRNLRVLGVHPPILHDGNGRQSAMIC